MRSSVKLVLAGMWIFGSAIPLSACRESSSASPARAVTKPGGNQQGDDSQPEDADASGGQLDPITEGSISGSVDAARLEQTVVAFAQCVSKQATIRIRFRSDPYIGLFYAVEAPDPVEGTRLEDRCASESMLGPTVSVFLQSHALGPADISSVIDRFTSCLAGSANLVPEVQELATIEDIEELQQRLSPTLDAVEGALFNSCKLESLYGKERTYENT